MDVNEHERLSNIQYINMDVDAIAYSYLMGVDAIDQTICPEVLGMTKCSSQYPVDFPFIGYLCRDSHSVVVYKTDFFTSLFICLFCKIVKFNIFYIGTFDQDTQCTPCSVGTFSSESSLDQCIPCTICGSNEIPKTKCNGITDTVCENKGKFSCRQ
jgi:hypothetical protein